MVLQTTAWPLGQTRGAGGKSGLHRITQGITTLRRKARNSGTERMSGAMSLKLGTGSYRGAAGVKTAKLCVEQDQIGKRKAFGPEKCDPHEASG